VFQQTPRSVTDAPPSLVTFPPEMASVLVIPVTFAVAKTGGVASFSFLQDVMITINPENRIINIVKIKNLFIALFLLSYLYLFFN
jgi:hypothetical protein